MKKRLLNNSGLTLIELILVVAIIGIMTGIATISSKGMYSNYRLKQAARQVFSDMQYVRLYAIKYGKEAVLDWETDAVGGISYKLNLKSGGPLPNRQGTIYLSGANARYGSMKACNQTGSAAEPIDVEFNPNGTATAGGIRLSMAGRVYKVYVSSSGTGNIRILNTADSAGNIMAACP